MIEAFIRGDNRPSRDLLAAGPIARDHGLSGGGKVGLWTKADNVTYFDDLSYEKR